MRFDGTDLRAKFQQTFFRWKNNQDSKWIWPVASSSWNFKYTIFRCTRSWSTFILIHICSDFNRVPVYYLFNTHYQLSICINWKAVNRSFMPLIGISILCSRDSMFWIHAAHVFVPNNGPIGRIDLNHTVRRLLLMNATNVNDVQWWWAHKKSMNIIVDVRNTSRDARWRW